VGWLAVDQQFLRRGLGASLEAEARAMRAEPAIYALVVDAKDEVALGFCEHFRLLPFRQPSEDFSRILLRDVGPIVKLSADADLYAYKQRARTSG
jgi:hypothetical protein